MRTAAPVFQLYRFGGENGVWWRLVSPNGRGMARSVAAFDSESTARAALAKVSADVGLLELTVRLTPEYRWHWSLRDGAGPVVDGFGDQDRRIRAVDASAKFCQLAPLAVVGAEVTVFRRVVRPQLGGVAHAEGGSRA